PPTGCCGRVASGGTATPTRSGRPSATPTTPTGWRSTPRRPNNPAPLRGRGGPARRRLRLPGGGRPPGGQGAAPVRAGGVDHRPVHRPPHPPPPPPVRGHPDAREVGVVEPGDRDPRQPVGVLGDGR